jgi:hypothetical protein
MAVKLSGTEINGRVIRVEYASPSNRNRERFGGQQKSPEERASGDANSPGLGKK